MIPVNETLKVLKERRSIRKYKKEQVAPETLDAILEAGTWAPTGIGMQSPIIIAVTNKELRDKLSKMNAEIMGSKADPFYGAPVVLVVLADKNKSTHVYDGSLVMGNLMLEFESEEGKGILKALGIEGDYEGIGHCVLGYAAEPAKEPKERKASYVYYAE